MYIKFKQATLSIKIGNAYIDANTKEKQAKVNTKIKVGVSYYRGKKGCD